MPVPYDAILPLKLRQGLVRWKKLPLVNINLSIPNIPSKQCRPAGTLAHRYPPTKKNPLASGILGMRPNCQAKLQAV
ncbi:MAG: hypothetical protein RSH52_04930, partial [Janthinobacterium sp.]